MTRTFDENLAQALTKYDVADATIAAWSEEFLQLAITDLDDREQLQRVHKARMVVREARVQVEKTRKALKADALEWGRRVDAEAKRITALLEPIEKHLEAEEDKPAAEKRRLEALEEERRVARLRRRMELLRDAGSPLLPQDVANVSDEDFEATLQRALEAKAQREAEEAERRAEQERHLAEERKRLEQERAEQERVRAAREAEEAVRRKEAQEALERERAALAAEQARIAEERARVEAEARRQAEAEAARKRAEEEKARAEREAAARAEAERIAAERAPDREKVAAFCRALADVPMPEVWCTPQIESELADCIGRILDLAEVAP